MEDLITIPQNVGVKASRRIARSVIRSVVATATLRRCADKSFHASSLCRP